MTQQRLSRGFLILIAIALFLIVHSTALAQSDSGTITGTIKDQAGGIVPGADVTVRNERTGEERMTKANSDGTFTIPGLKAATYSVTAIATGLAGKVIGVDVNVGQSV